MVKTYKKLDLFGPDLGQVLSILAVNVSRISKRTSEILFIDKWYKPSGNKGWLKEYGIEARGLICLKSIHFICHCTHPGTPLMRTVLR